MKMDSFSKTVLFSCFILYFTASSYAQSQNCSTYTFSNRRSYSSCTTLVLNSSIHWNYHQNRSVDIAYRHTGVTPSNWVAWALNPTGSSMLGAQSLVAFFNSTTSNIRAYTSPVTGFDTSLQEGPLSFPVPSIAAEFVENNIMIIYATIQLPEGSSTRFNHVWQQGDVLRNTPQRHPMDGDHRRSVGTIDFATGSTSGTSAPPPSSPPPAGGGNVLPPSGANDCPTFTSSNGNSFRQCNRLPVLDAFLHWNYHQDNHSVDIAYRHTAVGPTNWVAWALNPTGTNMLGAQALVAFVNSTGSFHAYTTPVTSYQTTLQEGPLSFPVQSIAADFINNNEMIIYATIALPAGSTSFTQVWQHGDIAGTTPQQHPLTADHRSSVGRIDFATGVASGSGAVGGGSRQRRRNTHGVLAVVSWGILMPLGAMAARYLKVFKSANPAWFYLHIACQSSAYIVGVAAWGTGLKLGSESAGVEHTTHRKIGIALFTLATLQAFALLLRPKPDHKYRFQWNVYHHAIGYSVIILSIINIFEGLEILEPEKKWKRAYVGVLIFMGASAAVLEALTWFIVVKRKRKSGSDKHPQHSGNGYHA